MKSGAEVDEGQGLMREDAVLRADLPVKARVHPLYSRSTTLSYIIGDFLVAFLTVVIAFLILAVLSRTAKNSLGQLPFNVMRARWFGVGLVIMMVASGTYRRSWRSPNQPSFLDLKDHVAAIGLAALFATLMNQASLVLSTGFVPNVLGFQFHFPNSSATQSAAFSLLACFTVPLFRSLLRRSILSDSPIRVLIADSGLRRERLDTHLRLTPGMQVVGWVAGKQTEGSQESLGELADIRQICLELEIDLVVIGSFELAAENTTKIYRSLEGICRISLLPRSFELVSWRSQLTEMSSLPLLEVSPPHISSWDRFSKRSFDIALASVLIVLTFPIMIITALGVKLTSRGPVLFKQERLGKDRKVFTVIKFRTMNVGALNEGQQTAASHQREDSLAAQRGKHLEVSRVTRPGRFLRRSGIDEFPQFFCVLRGTMSMIGPRPFVPEEAGHEDALELRRYEVRPGISGLWQISGRNELSESELKHLDYLYVASWSFWWDLRIALETPRVMLRGIGAY
ncbi:MAG: exopolysaccharide biosynthesis polyprenyl glycosylphosphotransferase [Actinomycetes bacterium]